MQPSDEIQRVLDVFRDYLAGRPDLELFRSTTSGRYGVVSWAEDEPVIRMLQNRQEALDFFLQEIYLDHYLAFGCHKLSGPAQLTPEQEQAIREAQQAYLNLLTMSNRAGE